LAAHPCAAGTSELIRGSLRFESIGRIERDTADGYRDIGIRYLSSDGFVMADGIDVRIALIERIACPVDYSYLPNDSLDGY
jgi:hypothetical protein